MRLTLKRGIVPFAVTVLMGSGRACARFVHTRDVRVARFLEKINILDSDLLPPLDLATFALGPSST